MGDSWVGGDIGGLQHMGTTLKGAKELLNRVVHPLSSKVDALVSDAGWQGDAAQRFRAAWVDDSMAAGGLADLVEAVGNVLTDLANNLSTANSALQNAADAAERQGTPIGPTGEPRELLTGNPPSTREQKAIAALRDYSNVYNAIMHEAQRARIDAAERINNLYAEIDPESPMATGDKITVADFLRGLWTAEIDHERGLGLDAASSLPEAQRRHDDALKALKAEEAKFRTPDRNIPKAWRLKGEYQAAATELDHLETQLGQAENGSTILPYDRELNYKLADTAKGVKLIEGAPKFLKEIPVIDIAASVAGGVLEAKDDHNEGWSWVRAARVDVGGALAGLTAGAVVGGAVAAQLPADAVIGGAALTGFVAVGVGVLTDKALHEHWSEDIHDHGVLPGTLDGLGHTATQTGETLKYLVVEPVKGIWHGVTNLF